MSKWWRHGCSTVDTVECRPCLVRTSPPAILCTGWETTASPLLPRRHASPRKRTRPHNWGELWWAKIWDELPSTRKVTLGMNYSTSSSLATPRPRDSIANTATWNTTTEMLSDGLVMGEWFYSSEFTDSQYTALVCLGVQSLYRLPRHYIECLGNQVN